MAILSFPKSPECHSETTSRASQPAPRWRAACPAFSGCTAWTPLFALLQAGLLLWTPYAFAQETGAAPSAAPPPSPAPGASAPAGAPAALWTRPVAPVSWTVAFKYGSVVAPEQAAQRPTQVKVTIVGKDALETVQFPDHTAEVWRTEGVVILSQAGSEHASLRVNHRSENVGGAGGVDELQRDKAGNFSGVVNGVQITGNIAQEDPDWTEFREFNWVTPAMLKGKIEISGEKLLVYSDMEAETPGSATPTGKGRAGSPPAPKFPPGPLGGLPLKPGIRVAAIEETNKTPRYLQVGENIQMYTFSKPQQTKLELPPKIAELVAKPPPPPEGAQPISLVP
jgi:hypothetical protein